MAQDYSPNPPGSYPPERGTGPDQPKPDLPKLKPAPTSIRRQVPLLGTFAAWLRVMTHPSVDTFTAESANATWGAVILGAVVEGIFLFTLLLITALNTSVLSSAIGELFRLTLIGMAIVVAGFLFRSVVLYVMARRTQGGDGNFKVQTYLYSLLFFPISILADVLLTLSVVAATPPNLFLYVLVIALLALSIYSLALTYLMLKAAHHIDGPGAGYTMVNGFTITFVVSVIVGLLFHYTFPSIMRLTVGFVGG